jgi:hypothetical protein
MKHTREIVMYDVKNLDKMKTLEVHAPETMKAFVAFDKAALAGGAIPGKYKELMALALRVRLSALIASSFIQIRHGRTGRRIRKWPKPCSLRRRYARVGRSRTARTP